MKLTRASLVALSTAAALTVSSLSAPAFADEGEGASEKQTQTQTETGAPAFADSSSVLTTADKTTDNVFGLSSGDDKDSDDKEGDAKLDLDTLQGWIKIIASVVSVIGDIVNIGK